MKYTNLTIKNITRLNNSIVGNPRYNITFDNGLSFKTIANGAVGYTVSNLCSDDILSEVITKIYFNKEVIIDIKR